MTLPFQLTKAKSVLMTSDDQKYFSQLATDESKLVQFRLDIEQLKNPGRNLEDTLRRFNLAGDGKADFNEFRLAMIRMGLNDQRYHIYDLFHLFSFRTPGKLDIDIFCKIIDLWKSGNVSSKLKSTSIANEIVHPLQSTSIQRIYEILSNNANTLQRIFLQMDMDQTGYISEQELALTLRHVGILISDVEQRNFYESLPSDTFIGENGHPKKVSYNVLLRSLPREGMKGNPTQSTRIWDILCKSVEILQYHFKSYERIYPHALPVEDFRDCLTRCGILMSEKDFVTLKIRLKVYNDSCGNILYKQLLNELSKDKTQSSNFSSSHSNDFFSSQSNGLTSIQSAFHANVSSHLDNKNMKENSFQEKPNENHNTNYQTIYLNKRVTRQELVGILLSKESEFINLCQRKDTNMCGIVSQADFLSIIEDSGIVLSSSDARFLLQNLRCKNSDHLGIAYKDFASCLRNSNESRNHHLNQVGLLVQQVFRMNDSTCQGDSTISHQISKIHPNCRQSTLDLSFNPTIVTSKSKNGNHHPKKKEIQQCMKMLVRQHGQLRIAFNKIVTPGKNGIVERNDIVRVLCSLRLDIFLDSHLARDILNTILPINIHTIVFNDFFQYLCDAVKGEDSDENVSSIESINVPDKKNNHNKRNLSHVNQELHNTGDQTTPASIFSFNPTSIVVNSLRQKLLKSRLSDLETTLGKQSAAVLLRRAFRVVCHSSGPVSDGQFDASGRKEDLPHILKRIGMESTLDEQSYLFQQLGTQDDFTSSALLNSLIQLSSGKTVF